MEPVNAGRADDILLLIEEIVKKIEASMKSKRWQMRGLRRPCPLCLLAIVVNLTGLHTEL
jgi:hypothetical protein